ncbi:Alpha-protein kinase vwkA [Tetrabaena socialis]|uniref:Alpha-protein kinase vwkA n=1 Tax=Tetrabaena socialis TaxID=47790 RepID=A0A2J7ZNY9_9CHLO|nr:Alpha-protein kinase vwkA [Tetrabaena socialis]|eukprot:PNH01985.1 Alpha-protein kinase vwkA [Tetrabaena socialis]
MHAGDKLGRSISVILDKLKTQTGVELYYFAHLNNSTHLMIRKFKEAIQDKFVNPNDVQKWLQAEDITHLEQLAEKIIRSSITSIQASLAAGAHGIKGGVIQLPLRKDKPAWETLTAVAGVAYRAVLEDAYHTIEMIKDKEPLELELFARMKIKIALHPFSDDGAARWPYYAKVVEDDTRSSIADFVVKRFKVPLGKNVLDIHAQKKYEDLVELQGICASMAREFNSQARGEDLEGVQKISFSQVSLLKVGTMFYCMEKELMGDFIKYSNNVGYVNTAEYADTLQAFSHWSWDFSDGVFMITDLQGVMDRTNNLFWLCDPAIHSAADINRFGDTNFGEEGYKLFFESHKCNSICKGLSLKRHPSQQRR